MADVEIPAMPPPQIPAPDALQAPPPDTPQVSAPDTVNRESDGSNSASGQEPTNTPPHDLQITNEEEAAGGPSNEESSDSTGKRKPENSQAKEAVLSAIKKMEIFQEALTFNLLGELHDLKHAVGTLPAVMPPPPGYPQGMLVQPPSSVASR
jgi:hypothetical protein